MSAPVNQLSQYTNVSELSNLLLSDKFGLLSILAYANGDTIYDGTTDCYDALVAAVANFPTSGGVIIFPSTANGGTYYLGTRKTLPPNCTLIFIDGASIKPENGVSLAGTNTKIQAGLNKIFDTSLGGTISGTWDIEKVHPEWFGNIVSGITESSAYIQASCDLIKSTGGIVRLGSKTYVMSTDITLTINHKPIRFIGNGWSNDNGQATRLLINAAVSGFIMQNGSNGHSWENININGSVLGLKAIDGTYGNRLRIWDCLIEEFKEGLDLRQGLCHVRNGYIRNCTDIGATINSDSWIESLEISICGVGLKVISGGNRVSHLLVNSCASYGIYGFGTDIANNDFGNLYIGENVGWNIYLDGDGGSRDIIINAVYVQQVSTAIAGGIKIKDCDYVNIGMINYYGGGLGSKADLQALSLDTCNYCTVGNFISHNSTLEDILLTNSNDCSINNINIQNHANSATPAASLYAIRTVGSIRNMFNGVKITESRGGGAFSKGIETATGSYSVIIGYYPYAVVDSFDTTTRKLLYNINTQLLEISNMVIDSEFYFGNGTGLFTGSGSPENVKVAKPGSIYLNLTGGVNVSIYVKESGSGNTGWVPK